MKFHIYHPHHTNDIVKIKQSIENVDQKVKILWKTKQNKKPILLFITELKSNDSNRFI